MIKFENLHKINFFIQLLMLDYRLKITSDNKTGFVTLSAMVTKPAM